MVSVSAFIVKYLVWPFLPRHWRREDTRLWVQDTHYTVAIRGSESTVLTEVHLDHLYEKVPDFVSRAGWTVVDAGANVGIFSVQQARRGTRVYAFEPNPECFHRLTQTVAVNGLSTAITVYNDALGSVAGTASLVVGESTLAGYVAPSNGNGDNHSVSVQVRRLDEVMESLELERVDLLKIDVEGSELEVLKGAAQSLQLVDRIVMEIHSQQLFEACESLLNRQGFRRRLQLHTIPAMGISHVYYARQGTEEMAVEPAVRSRAAGQPDRAVQDPARIKVLYLYPHEFYGNPDLLVLAQLLRHLDRTRFAAHLILNREGSGVLNLRDAPGLTIRTWRFGRSLRVAPALRSMLPLPRAVLELVLYARQQGIEIVHCACTPRAAALGLLLSRLCGARLLLHSVQLPGQSGLRRRVEMEVCRAADLAVTASAYLAMALERTAGVRPERVEVVRNGVDLTAFHPGGDGSAIRRGYGIADEAPLLLQLGRITAGKRQEDFVRAFAIARRRVPELRGLLVGWEDPRPCPPFSSYEARLRHLCAEERLGDSIVIAPARPESAQLMRAADVFVMPSEDDVLPLVVSEAMATGKPVIGADSGGIPEQVVDGVTGFLVPVGEIEALAGKMVLLARDAELRARLGAAGRQRAEQHFDESRVGAAFARLYEVVLAANVRAA
jgi:FkbM family methyltransferase